VGVITAIGFLVGVAWPRIAGVRLGPSVPEGPASPSVASAPAPPSAAPPESVAATAAYSTVPAVASSPPPAAPAPPPPPSVTVGRGIVFACRTAEGESLKGADCGSLGGLDGLVASRLRKLADCTDAAGLNGKVHLVLHIDFPRGGLSVDLGRGHSIASSDAILACAKADMTGLALTGVSHDNPRYSVAYTVTFGGGGPAAAGGSPTHSGVDGADDKAQVVWEVAIVRDAPKTGKVIARLQRGTELHLGAARDGWYPVKFGDGFASDGWLYRGAIGK
jgi:hypothetical protein